MLQRPRPAPPPTPAPPPPRAAAPSPSWTAAWRAQTRRTSTGNPSCLELARPFQSLLELHLELIRVRLWAAAAETREKVEQNLIMILEWPRGETLASITSLSGRRGGLLGDSVQRNELILLVYLFLQPLTTTVHFNVVIQDSHRVAKLYSLQVYLDIYSFMPIVVSHKMKMT